MSCHCVNRPLLVQFWFPWRIAAELFVSGAYGQ